MLVGWRCGVRGFWRILVDNRVQVSEPKTAKVRRSLALDPVTVAALRAHRARQAERSWRLVAAIAIPTWCSRARMGLLCIRSGSRTGSASIFGRLGWPRIRLHDVRHSYASAALAAGVPAKVVSERLGHANIAITMDTYSHVLPGLDEQAAGQVARLILGAGDPGSANAS